MSYLDESNLFDYYLKQSEDIMKKEKKYNYISQSIYSETDIQTSNKEINESYDNSEKNIIFENISENKVLLEKNFKNQILDKDFDFFEEININDSKAISNYSNSGITNDFNDVYNYEDYRLYQDSVDIDAYITDEDNAYDTVEKISDIFNLSVKQYFKLVELFTTKSHFLTKKTIMEFLQFGYTPEEILLAYDIKVYWEEETFLHHSYNRKHNFFYTNRQILSWKVALKIIDIFNGIPSLDEVIYFLNNLYQNWIDKIIFNKIRCFGNYLIIFLHSTNFNDAISPEVCLINGVIYE